MGPVEVQKNLTIETTYRTSQSGFIGEVALILMLKVSYQIQYQEWEVVVLSPEWSMQRWF